MLREENISHLRVENITIAYHGLTYFWRNVIGVTLILIGK